MNSGDGRDPPGPHLRLISPPTILPPPQFGDSPKNRDDLHRQVLDGVTPLDIVIRTAQALWDSAVQPDGTINTDKAERAALIAEKALPFLNPKLAAVAVKNVDEEKNRERRAVESDASAVRSKIAKMIDRKSDANRA